MARPGATRFTMRHRDLASDRAFWSTVVVYETAADMRQAAIRHRPTQNPESVANSGGCFQAAGSGHPTYLGIMRLTRELLTPAAVVHESVHAALVYVQKVQDVNVLQMDAWSAGRRLIDNEEALAYAVHGISSALLAELGLTAGC